jgi:hypothetical protein
MAMSRDEYVRAVIDQCDRLVSAMNNEVPVRFRLVNVYGPQSDWKLSLELDSDDKPGERVDCLDRLQSLERKLNDDFKGNSWYFGIAVLASDRFLGQYGVECLRMRLQQESDNTTYRQVRLRNLDNG